MIIFIATLFTLLMTLSFKLGDMFGIVLSLVGFLIMFYFAEEYEKNENLRNRRK